MYQIWIKTKTHNQEYPKQTKQSTWEDHKSELAKDKEHALSAFNDSIINENSSFNGSCFIVERKDSRSEQAMKLNAQMQLITKIRHRMCNWGN
jgi:hypothetical protein